MTSKFLVIKKYSDCETLKYFVVYGDKYGNEEVLKKILEEMKKRKIRNVGEFLVCEMLKDIMYLKRFTKIPEEPETWWLEGQKIFSLNFKEFHIISKEMERWVKYDK